MLLLARRAQPHLPRRLRPTAASRSTKRMASAATAGQQAAPASTTTAAKPLVLVVAAAILRRRPGGAADAAEVLLAQRPEGKALAGTWEFPGGKVDASDMSPEHALARELEEELGLKGVEPSRLRPLTFASHAYKKFHLLMPLYALELTESDREPRGMEGQAVAWSTAEELKEGKWAMPPADDPLVEPVVAALRELEGRGRR